MAVRTSVGSGDWSEAGTWNTGVPVDGDSVVIAAGHAVKFNVNMAAWTGLVGLTITSSAGTPGMLYWEYTTPGTYMLKIRTTYNIVGTNAANRGRILANSDGVWGNTGALPYAIKAIIYLTTTAQLQAQYLDVVMRCDEPAQKYVECYGEDYGPLEQNETNINLATGVFTWPEAPPANGTAVRLRSTGTLPGEFDIDGVYYTALVSGNTCALYGYSTTTKTIIIPTSTGTGNLTMYSSWLQTNAVQWGAGKNTPKILQNVTADKWTAGDYVTIENEGPAAYDIQKLTVTTINPTTMVLSAAVDSTQYPLSKIVLGSRNCAIRSTAGATSTPVIVYASANTHGGIFGEVSAIGSATAYGYGINYGYGVSVSVMWGWSQAIRYGSYANISNAVFVGCASGIVGAVGVAYNGSYHNISNSLFLGCSAPISGTPYPTITGCTFAGCSDTVYSSWGTITSSKIYGCQYGVRGVNNTLNNTNLILSCLYGVEGYGHIISCDIKYCSYGAYTLYYSYLDNMTIKYCTNGIGTAYFIYGGPNLTLSNIDSGLHTVIYSQFCGTITQCVYGIIYPRGLYLNNAILYANTNDLRYNGYLIGNGASLRSGTQAVNYMTYISPQYTLDYAGMFIYDPKDGSGVKQVGRIIGWTNGGKIYAVESASVPPSPPVALTFCHIMTFENAGAGYPSCPNHCDHPIRMIAGQKYTIPVYLKCSVSPSGMTARPRVQLIDQVYVSESTEAKLVDTQIADTTAWQTVVIEYTPAEDKDLLIRIRGTNASGTLHWYTDLSKVKPSLPAANLVRPPNTYGYYGDLLTGTYTPTFPAAANVWHDTGTYGEDGNNYTPEMVGSDITNLTAANVKKNVIIDNVTGEYEALGGGGSSVINSSSIIRAVK